MSNNTQWRQDRDGHYIEFPLGTDFMEVSFNYDSELTGSEIITTVTATCATLTVNAVFPFFKQTQGDYNTAVVQFGAMNTVGSHLVDMTVTTDQGRVYSSQFRVKVV